MKAITVKYHGATDLKGARITASDSDGHRVTVSRSYDLEITQDSARAAIALCKKMGWTGTLISGGTKDAEVFVFAHSEHFEIK